MKTAFVILILLFSMNGISQGTPMHQLPSTIWDIEGKTNLESGFSQFDIQSSPGAINQTTDLSSQNHGIIDANFYVKLSVEGINGLHEIGEALEEVVCTLNVKRVFFGGDFINEQVILTLSGTKAEALYTLNFKDVLLDETIDYINVESITVDPVNVNGNFSSLTSDIEAYINQNINLKAWYEMDYGIDVKQPAPDLLDCEALIPVYPYFSATLDVRVQTFTWNSLQGYHFPNYEFQLLKLENTSTNNLTPESEQLEQITAELDWSKALTVETYNYKKELTLTIAQGSGYYYWRVRPIGNFYEGGIANSKNWGVWSSVPPDNLTFNKTNYASYGTIFKYEDPDDDLNWIYSRVFTEDGNVGEGINYANNLLQSVQSQAYSSSQKRVITSQSLYDFVGRSAMSTLPVPSDGEDILNGYKENFILNSTGGLYTAVDFDSDARIQDPSVVETLPTSTYAYYSDNNADLSIPDAEGYPFSRTIFMNDGSGRPIEQSGVGKTHAIGQITPDGNSHTTTVYYGTPSDEELINIFGDEAPLAENVIKTSTKDPNGTISIVYTTLEGKTIATAMSKDSPTNLENIAEGTGDENNQLTTLGNVNFSTIVNTVDQNMFISSKVITLDKSTPINLSYKVDQSTLDNSCGTPNCEYQIKFRIVNEVTGEYFETTPADLVAGQFTSFSNINFDFLGNTWSEQKISDTDLDATVENVYQITLPEGYWKVQKVVYSKISLDDLNANGPMAKLGPLMEVVTNLMSSVKNKNQYDQFLQDIRALNDEISLAHTNAEIACGTQDFTDPCYQSYGEFNEIKLKYELKPDYIFDPNYTLSVPLLPDGTPKTISFQAGCCDNIEVDIPGAKQHEVCQPIDEKIGLGTLTQNDIVFSQAFKDLYDELVDEGSLPTNNNLGSEWIDAMPGYGLIADPDNDGVYTSKFDQMIYHMLQDQYYTGKAEYVSPNWVQWGTSTNVYGINGSIPAGASQELYGPYYTCNNIYNCWYAALRAYYQMYAVKGESFNIYDLTKDDQDPSGASDPTGDFFDDPDNRDSESGFIDWLADLLISVKMKKFSDQMAGENGEPKSFAFQLNVPDLFLECTGKKIAAIIGPEVDGELNIDVLKNDLEYIDINDNNNVKNFTTYNAYIANDINHDLPLKAVDKNGGTLTPEVLMYRNIYEPLWAFKYYEYVPDIKFNAQSTPPNFEHEPYTNEPNLPDPHLPAVPSIEVKSCYHKFDLNNTATTPICGSNPCPESHHNWDAEERARFYRNIIYSKEDEDFLDDANNAALNSANHPVACPTQNELNNMVTAEFNAAESYCISREAEFRQGIENMLIENCYTLVPCYDGTVSNDNYISASEIDVIVMNTVAACTTYVDSIKSECEGSMAYPTCSTQTCQYWNGTGFSEETEVIIELFDPAYDTKAKLNDVKFGSFIPFLEPGDSKCNPLVQGDPPIPVPAWYGGTGILNCPDQELVPVTVINN